MILSPICADNFWCEVVAGFQTFVIEPGSQIGGALEQQCCARCFGVLAHWMILFMKQFLNQPKAPVSFLSLGVWWVLLLFHCGAWCLGGHYFHQGGEVRSCSSRSAVIRVFHQHSRVCQMCSSGL